MVVVMGVIKWKTCTICMTLVICMLQMQYENQFTTKLACGIENLSLELPCQMSSKKSLNKTPLRTNTANQTSSNITLISNMFCSGIRLTPELKHLNMPRTQTFRESETVKQSTCRFGVAVFTIVIM